MYGSLPGDPDVWNEGVSSKGYGPPVSPGYGWGLYILSCRYMYILPESYIYNIYIYIKSISIKCVYIYIILCIILYNTNFKQDICHCNTLSLSDPKAWPPVSVLPRRFDHEDGPSKIIRVSLSFWREATTQYLVTREFHSHAVLMAPGHLARKLSRPRPGDQRSPETSEKRGPKNWVIKIYQNGRSIFSI